MSRLKAKDTFNVFFDKGVVHHEFVPEGQFVTGAFYVEVLKRLREESTNYRQLKTAS